MPARSRYDLSNSFEGRTALVTGGSSGIGEKCADAFADCGGNVAITYAKGKDRAEAIQGRLGGPDRVSIHKLDLTSADSIGEVIGSVRERWSDWSGNGALVHSAAVGSATVKRYLPQEATEADEIAAFYGINTIGSHLLIKATYEAMLADPSTARRDMVIISSVGSRLQVFPGFQIADGVSKAALAYLMDNYAALTVRDRRFRINTVCPGATDTPMLQASFLDQLDPAARADFDAQHVPKGRVTPPEEIADLVLYLCSDLARAIHGATIDASTGLALRPGLITEMGGH